MAQLVVHFEVVGRDAAAGSQVPDVEAALAKAESLGGARIMGPATIMENVTLGQFSDPEGNVVGLVQAAA